MKHANQKNNDVVQPDLICFSHLRWNFVFQRPQHLLTRFCKKQRVFFVEEPIFGAEEPHWRVEKVQQNLHIAVPHLPSGLSDDQVWAQMRYLIDNLVASHKINAHVSWYYTPMALPFSRHLEPEAVIYDCMDELSLFKGVHPMLTKLEKELLDRADVVFTGGQSLYEEKRRKHTNVHAMPSSVDVEHFGKARMPLIEPVCQKDIPHPRIGFFGVIDERMDLELVDAIAEMEPQWQFVFIGPVVKISEDSLPRRPNIHYLGMKRYAELPDYLAHWDIAMLPFARNDSTKFISPTKTPEYLAAGKPVISTSIKDVVEPYGRLNLVSIANMPEEFAAAAQCMLQIGMSGEWRAKVERFLSQMSWDKTYQKMSSLIDQAVSKREDATQANAFPLDSTYGSRREIFVTP